VATGTLREFPPDTFEIECCRPSSRGHERPDVVTGNREAPPQRLNGNDEEVSARRTERPDIDATEVCLDQPARQSALTRVPGGFQRAHGRWVRSRANVSGRVRSAWPPETAIGFSLDSKCTWPLRSTTPVIRSRN